MSRSQAVQRTAALFDYAYRKRADDADRETFLQTPELNDILDRLILESGQSVSRRKLISITLAMMFATFALSIQFFSFIFSAFSGFAVGSMPFLYLNRSAERRSTAFLEEYPTVLLAMASSIKAGLTPLVALERAGLLLPQGNILRIEIEELLRAFARGEAKETIVAEFGRSIRQPDIKLFRLAFLLVLEHGGSFSRTLEQLAGTCRDRETLIRQARVSTSNMRLTATILLLMTPITMAMIAVRSENYFELLFDNPTANSIASLGFAIIGASYGALRKMSGFRP